MGRSMVNCRPPDPIGSTSSPELGTVRRRGWLVPGVPCLAGAGESVAIGTGLDGEMAKW